MQEGPIWTPGPERVRTSLLTAFAKEDYASLHRWSIENPGSFWQSVWDFCNVKGTPGHVPLLYGNCMPGARWFPEARLNFAENLLRSKDHSDAIVFWGETRIQRRLSYAELYKEVACLAAAFRSAGVVVGDRVAAWMPNLPETVIAMLAASSIGAVFSSCSPDFGVDAVVDRFGQIRPKILIAADGYFYNGKTIHTVEKLETIVDRLPSLERVVIVPYLGASSAGRSSASWYSDFVRPHADVDEIDFAALAFDHPLYILYSSGTTGAPKCIVHGAGGTLLQHLKEHQLHGDIKSGDRLFYFTTCGWMMWNWLVSALASNATLLLYDGSPLIRENSILFDYADAERATHFGTSAKFLDSIRKGGLQPIKTHRLNALRTIFSTGSPLDPEAFDYVYRDIKLDINLASISGGTDIVSCFVLGCPALPVWRGEIQCRGLGMAVEVFDETGVPVRGAKGDLVCTRPFPSMPLGFLNDPGGSKFHAAYFEKYPGVWAHGDYAEITEHDGIIIHGRSDAVLNPGGVRIGTAEIYRQVEQLPEILEALAIGQEWSGDVRVILFVKLKEGVALDASLIEKIRRTVREGASPRHVPQKIIAVDDVPHTRSGKIVELAVRDVIHGRPVKNRDSLANPEALLFFENLAELQS